MTDLIVHIAGAPVQVGIPLWVPEDELCRRGGQVACGVRILNDPTQLRTDPRIIRQILADAEATSPYAASRRAHLTPRTVYRWALRRASDPEWPTDADAEAWAQTRAVKTRRRAYVAALQRDYRKRVYAAGGPMVIDAVGTTRRLQALYAIGWTSAQIGPRLGVTPARVSHLVSGKQPKVHRHTAARVARVYDDLSMTVPRDPGHLEPRHIRIHDRQRRQSANKGWPPPLAWDDIDDPTEEPTSWAYQPPNRADFLLELADDGAGLAEACGHLRVSAESLQKWCAMYGYRHVYRALAARDGRGTNQHRRAVA